MKQRIIKFRAWDKQINVMSNWDYIKDIWDLKYLEGKDKDTIIMQFTGLKDKNGKEIFEGDIVKEKNISDGEHIRKVVFEKGGFWLEGKDGSGGWLFIPLSIEIIGNIYENPELLNNKTKR